MNKTYHVGVTATALTDEDDETLILDGSDISRKLAKRIRTFQTETELLQYLLKHKPQELKCGREHYLDLRELDEYMSGLCLKLNIHGYEDRGDRLKYLHSILCRKFKEKNDILKNITKFIIDMSQRPTSVTNMVISSEQYSPEPDEENSIDEDSARQRELLKLILAEGEIENEIPENHFSSGSELSDWSTDDEEQEDEISNNDIPLIPKIRHSSSFGEFSDINCELKPDPELLKQEIKLFWAHEKSKAESYLQQQIRKFDLVPLSSQPVISSLLVLQSRFGEFWEWKRCSKQKIQMFVVFEEDIVREILWQFTITNTASSPLFSQDWKVIPRLMVATLSISSFTTLVNKYGEVFSKLQDLRQFTNTVEKLSLSESEGKSTSPSKVYRNYAAGIMEVSRYITFCISKLERELKRKQRLINDPSEPACTTLLQMEKQTRSIVDFIQKLHEIHSKGIALSENEEQMDPWFASIQLISCLETHLLLETKPSLYGILLFLFSKCLYALLDEIVTALKSLKWDENYSLFIRDGLVRLNDSSFWSECIKVRPYQERLKMKGMKPLACLEKLLPKVLNVLKTCEVLDQLEEDFMRILGKSNIIISEVVREFLDESFASNNGLGFSENGAQADEIDYMKHFSYIGLGSSSVTDSFRFLTAPEYLTPVTSDIGKSRTYKFQEFVSLSRIPLIAHTVTLDKALSKYFNPFCVTAKENIQKIFQDYKVIESMTIFQEIILAVREDFARALIEIASNQKQSEFKYEDNFNRNPKFQKLLNECYPEGRDNFSVDLKLDSSSDMNCTFLVTPHFPLNLIVTPQSVAGYIFIGRQLHRIRKSLWDVSSLSTKECKPSEGVDVTRLLMFRFCLINFCSSIRSFFTLKLFSKDFSEFAKSASYEDDLDSIRRIHEDYLESIETRMLRNPVIENVVIRQIAVMSELLRKRWSTGMPQPAMLMLEDTLKKCWHVVNDFQSTKYSFDFNELSFHFGRPPTCL